MQQPRYSLTATPVEWIKREILEIHKHLIGIILEDKDADSLLADIEELHGQVAARRRTAKPIGGKDRYSMPQRDNEVIMRRIANKYLWRHRYSLEAAQGYVERYQKMGKENGWDSLAREGYSFWKDQLEASKQAVAELEDILSV